MPRGMTKQKELDLEDRRAKVAKEVLSGVPYRELATKFSVSLGTIANDVKTVVKRYREDQVDEFADVIQLELQRIDVALNAIWKKVIRGNDEAIKTMIQLQNQRAKYLGLFEPETNKFLLLFSDLAAKDKQISVEEIRRKRWEKVYPQLQEVIDVEAKDVTNTSQLPDGSSQPAKDGGSSGRIPADSA